MMTITFRTIKRFVTNEDGVATAWAISWLILCFAIAGLSIDVTNAWRVQEFLQSTADVAAHAGAIELGTAGNAGIQTAVAVKANYYAEQNMNTNSYGDVLIDNDIVVGNYNYDTRVFTPMAAGGLEPDAVKVTTRQDGTNGASNVVGTFFLRFVSKDNFTLSSSAIVQKFISVCETDGIKARGDANASSSNVILDKTCFYGGESITFAQNVTFEDGTTAMTRDIENCGPAATSCTNAHNPGIEEALTQGTMTLPKVDKVSEYHTSLQSSLSTYQPDYITAGLASLQFTTRSFDPETDLQAGRVHVIQCRSGENVNLERASTGNGNSSDDDDDSGPVTISDVVVVGIGCDFVFDETIRFEDAVFVTDATGSQTISGSAGVVLGKDDDCAPGGEVAIITAGSVRFAAKLEAYDVEFIIAQNLNLASRGTEDSVHQGTDFNVGGDVRITTHHAFASCEGTGSVIDQHYSYRLVN